MKILIKIFLKASLILALLAATACIIWFLPGDYNHDLAALINKRDMLISKKAPRIIVIGGSNLITLTSQKIEKIINSSLTVPYHMVNAGMWGGLSMRQYLEEIKPYVKPQDMVIICQEYASLLDTAFYAETEKNEEGKKFLFLMSPIEKTRQYIQQADYMEILKIVTLLNQLKIKTYLHLAIKSDWSHVVTNGFYRYHQDYNSYGDRKFPFKVIRPLISSGIKFQDPVVHNLLYLKNFQDYGDKKNIRVYFSFPPFPESEYRLNKKYISALHHVLRDILNIRLLTKPDDTVYPTSYFADTVYHLQPAGENLRSQTLTDRLIKITSR